MLPRQRAVLTSVENAETSPRSFARACRTVVIYALATFVALSMGSRFADRSAGVPPMTALSTRSPVGSEAGNRVGESPRRMGEDSLPSPPEGTVAAAAAAQNHDDLRGEADMPLLAALTEAAVRDPAQASVNDESSQLYLHGSPVFFGKNDEQRRPALPERGDAFLSARPFPEKHQRPSGTTISEAHWPFALTFHPPTDDWKHARCRNASPENSTASAVVSNPAAPHDGTVVCYEVGHAVALRRCLSNYWHGTVEFVLPLLLARAAALRRIARTPLAVRRAAATIFEGEEEPTAADIDAVAGELARRAQARSDVLLVKAPARNAWGLHNAGCPTMNYYPYGAEAARLAGWMVHAVVQPPAVSQRARLEATMAAHAPRPRQRQRPRGRGAKGAAGTAAPTDAAAGAEGTDGPNVFFFAEAPPSNKFRSDPQRDATRARVAQFFVGTLDRCAAFPIAPDVWPFYEPPPVAAPAPAAAAAGGAAPLSLPPSSPLRACRRGLEVARRYFLSALLPPILSKAPTAELGSAPTSASDDVVDMPVTAAELACPVVGVIHRNGTGNGRELVGFADILAALEQSVAARSNGCGRVRVLSLGSTGGTIRDQIAEVMGATIVVGARGMGMTHALFQREGSGLVVISGRSNRSADGAPLSFQRDNFPWYPFPVARHTTSAVLVDCPAVRNDGPPTTYQEIRCKHRSINFCNIRCDPAAVVEGVTTALRMMAVLLRRRGTNATVASAAGNDSPFLRVPRV